MSKILFIGLKKKTCFGYFRIEEIRDKDNETGFGRGRRSRNVNLQCFPYTRCFFALKYLPGISSVSGKERKTRTNDSLKTAWPNESAKTAKPPVFSMQHFISNRPDWSNEQANMSTTCKFLTQRSAILS